MPSAPAENLPENKTSLQTLHASIPPHFQQAQHSLANHRKNIVSLYRIHQKAATITEKTTKGTRLVGEKSFNEVFFGGLGRVLPIKKGVPNADRVCKFVAAYAIYAQEQFRLQARAISKQSKADKSNQGKEDEDDDDDDEEQDTPATRFTSLLLKHLLKGFASKDKNVRLRCCGCVALLINGLESLDEALFQTLKSFLLARARDKESSVRVQAVIALAKLEASEDDQDPDDNDSDENSDVRQVLIQVLRFDPSAEVRRAALFNITSTKETQPYVIERLRDIDPINRRCVYLGSLSLLVQAQIKSQQQPSATQPGPSRLGIDSDAADEVIQIGMGDREPSVKRAAKKLVLTWFDACAADLIKFLNQFDVIANKHMEAAVLTILDARPVIPNQVSFESDQFWSNLSPQTAFLARVFVDFFKRTKNEQRLEECLPPVTALGFRIQKEYQELVEIIGQYGLLGEETQTEEERRAVVLVIRNKSFIVSELLGIALASDYGDEIGRRKMFGLVRDMISDPDLPQDLIPHCLDVLLKLSNGQRDFMRIVVEIVQVLGGDAEEEEEERSEHADDDDDEAMSVDEPSSKAVRKPRKSQRPKEGSREPDQDAIQLALEERRLLIVRSMLERVVGALQENTAFHGLIPQLIAPAVRSKEPMIRELALVCLGLCCLLDAKLALDSFSLFINQVQNGIETIKLRAVQTVFDLIIMHGISFICSRNPAGEEIAKRQIVTYLLSLLEDEDPLVQSAACEGMAKLMLTGMVGDDEALKSLVLIYMSPETADNQELRQCLSYFLPVYCASSSSNQRSLQRVFVSTLQVLTEVYLDKEDGQEMVTPSQIGLQLLDWTDPEKVMVTNGRPLDQTIHVDVAIDLVRAIFRTDAKDERKTMCQLLGKIYLPDELNEWKIKELLILSSTMKQVNPFEDAVSRNALGRFEAALAKAYPETVNAGIADINVEETEELSDLKAFFESCGIDPKEAQTSLNSKAKQTAASKTKPATAKRNTTRKSQVVSDVSEEDEDDEEDEHEEATEEEEEDEE